MLQMFRERENSHVPSQWRYKFEISGNINQHFCWINVTKSKYGSRFLYIKTRRASRPYIQQNFLVLVNRKACQISRPFYSFYENTWLFSCLTYQCVEMKFIQNIFDFFFFFSLMKRFTVLLVRHLLAHCGDFSGSFACSCDVRQIIGARRWRRIFKQPPIISTWQFHTIAILVVLVVGNWKV